MMKKDHCKGCVYFNKGLTNTRYSNWCCKHSNTIKKSYSLCVIHNSKKVKE